MATLSGITGGSLTEHVTINKINITSVAKPINLFGVTSGSNVYATFRKQDSTSGYQVPSGKKLIIIGGYAFTNGTAGDLGIQWGTNDVGFSSGTAPTGQVGNMYFVLIPSQALTKFSLIQEVAAGNFPCMVFPSSSVQAVNIFGFEIDADATTI